MKHTKGWFYWFFHISVFTFALSSLVAVIFMLVNISEYKYNIRSNCLNCPDNYIIVTVTPSPTPEMWEIECRKKTIEQYYDYLRKGDCECDKEENVKKIKTKSIIFQGKQTYYEHWIVENAQDYYDEAQSIAFNCLLTPTAGALVEEAQLREAECELRWFLKKTDWDNMEEQKDSYWNNIDELQKRHDILEDYYNLSIQRLDMPPFEGYDANLKARYNNVRYISDHINDFMNEIWKRIRVLVTGARGYNKKTDEWEDVYKYELNKQTRKWTPINPYRFSDGTVVDKDKIMEVGK